MVLVNVAQLWYRKHLNELSVVLAMAVISALLPVVLLRSLASTTRSIVTLGIDGSPLGTRRGCNVGSSARHA
jgi:hypothetical protein